jgi:aminomethyltransferase
LAAEAARGPEWRFVGIEIDWSSFERLYAEAGLATHVPSAAWRMSVPLYSGGQQVGYATSGVWSPLLKKYIALAHLQGSPGELEIEFTIEHRRRRAKAQVTKKPFFDPERKRK